jgi:DNA-directed RNA polymerase specialized sigma24 family protein
MKILLETAIAGLPQKYRAVYVLREVQQLSVAETAKCLGISTESVKVNLHRAREKLKATLLRSAAAEELFGYPAKFCDRMTARVMQRVLGVR